MRREDLILARYHVNVRARCVGHDSQMLAERIGTSAPDRNPGHCIARIITTRMHPIARMHKELLKRGAR